MLLALVIKNDTVSLGVFDGGALRTSAAVATDTHKTADEYAVLLKSILAFHGFSVSDLTDAICASVVPAVTETMREAVRLLTGCRPHLIGSGVKTGLTIATENPAELGGDLVAAAVGALSRYPLPLILLDLGTAATFSVIDAKGEFIGCAIAPGVALSAEALSAKAELLPHAAAKAPKSVIGKNTAESLRAGSLFGAASMIDGVLERMEDALGTKATVIVSGKDADTLLPLCRHAATRDDTLALLGLSLIFEKNKRK